MFGANSGKCAVEGCGASFTQPNGEKHWVGDSGRFYGLGGRMVSVCSKCFNEVTASGRRERIIHERMAAKCQ